MLVNLGSPGNRYVGLPGNPKIPKKIPKEISRKAKTRKAKTEIPSDRYVAEPWNRYVELPGVRTPPKKTKAWKHNTQPLWVSRVREFRDHQHPPASKTEKEGPQLGFTWRGSPWPTGTRKEPDKRRVRLPERPAGTPNSTNTMPDGTGGRARQYNLFSKS